MVERTKDSDYTFESFLEESAAFLAGKFPETAGKMTESELRQASIPFLRDVLMAKGVQCPGPHAAYRLEKSGMYPLRGVELDYTKILDENDELFAFYYAIFRRNR